MNTLVSKAQQRVGSVAQQPMLWRWLPSDRGEARKIAFLLSLSYALAGI